MTICLNALSGKGASSDSASVNTEDSEEKNVQNVKMMKHLAVCKRGSFQKVRRSWSWSAASFRGHLPEKWGKLQWKETFNLQEELKTCWNVSLRFLPRCRRARANPSSSKTPHILTFCRSPWRLRGTRLTTSSTKLCDPVQSLHHFGQVAPQNGGYIWLRSGWVKKKTHRTHWRQQQTCKFYANGFKLEMGTHYGGCLAACFYFYSKTLHFLLSI